MTYELKVRSSVRARMFLGGTYFRAKKVGQDGNNISIECVKIDGKQMLVVTNHNTLKAENVTGAVDVDILEQELEWNEGVIIDQLSTTPRARKYSISSQITPTFEDIGPFSFTRLLYLGSKLSVKLTPKQPEFAPTDEIRIGARFRAYELNAITVTVETGPASPETGVAPTETYSGWDIDALRAAMQDNPWIEMVPRGYDAQDIIAKDDPVMALFDKTYLKGGDGMPEFPVGLPVGPETSMVYLKVSEAHNGFWAPTNVVYAWQGEEWKPYSP